MGRLDAIVIIIVLVAATIGGFRLAIPATEARLCAMATHYPETASQQFNPSTRWAIAEDMNCNGSFTITDAAHLIKWVFFAPGDLFVELIAPTQFGIFLELNPVPYGGFISWVISLASWGLLIVFTLATFGLVLIIQLTRAEVKRQNNARR